MGYLLKVISLQCIETEDSTGADEAYLRVNGGDIWRGDLNDGDSAVVQKVVPFDGQATIELFDEDDDFLFVSDDDDFLGSNTITTASAGLGEQTAYFTGDDANYTLTYQVAADPFG